MTERTTNRGNLGVFESVGIDPRRARFLLLKSRMYCRPVFRADRRSAGGSATAAA